MKIMLVDDHRIIRDGLRALIEREPGMQVVAEADNGPEAVSLALELAPDVVIMDISLPGLNGILATRKIITENPGIRVIALSVHSDRWSMGKMFKAGASGYLLKHCAFEELALAIKTVGKNKFYLSSSIACEVINEYVLQLKNSRPSESDLTAREREVLLLIAEGGTVGEIASSLGLSKKTVEAHRSQIMKKLGLHNLAALVRYAIQEGLVSVNLILSPENPGW